MNFYLSPPLLDDEDIARVVGALESGWVSPTGPDVERFEREFSERLGGTGVLGVVNGTAAIQLAVDALDLPAGSRIAVQDATFAATVFPVVRAGLEPVLVDSEDVSVNISSDLLQETVVRYSGSDRPIRAVIVVHQYGQIADLSGVHAVCRDHGLPLIEDAAEAIGGVHHELGTVGTVGDFGIFSFNGNKLITGSSGGALTARDPEALARARYLANQAKDPTPFYRHGAIGFNFRLSNILAALCSSQLRHIQGRIAGRRRVAEMYARALSGEGLELQPSGPWGDHTRWLTVVQGERLEIGEGLNELPPRLASQGTEVRRSWNPMHRQPVFRDLDFVGSGASFQFFQRSLCLPSSQELTESDVDIITRQLLDALDAVSPTRRLLKK